MIKSMLKCAALAVSLTAMAVPVALADWVVAPWKAPRTAYYQFSQSGKRVDYGVGSHPLGGTTTRVFSLNRTANTAHFAASRCTGSGETLLQIGFEASGVSANGEFSWTPTCPAGFTLALGTAAMEVP